MQKENQILLELLNGVDNWADLKLSRPKIGLHFKSVNFFQDETMVYKLGGQ